MFKRVLLCKVLVLCFFVLYPLRALAADSQLLLSFDDKGYPFVYSFATPEKAKYVRSADELSKLFKSGKIVLDSIQNGALSGGLITAEKITNIPVGIIEDSNTVDTDGDGLGDELEKVLGTDPSNPDSDHDSYTDGEEVKNSYNPLGTNKIVPNEQEMKKMTGKFVAVIGEQGLKTPAWFISPLDKRRYYMGSYGSPEEKEQLNNDFARVIPKVVKYPAKNVKQDKIIAFAKKEAVRSRDSRRLSNLKTIQAALELYYTDNGTYPKQNGNLGKGNFSCLNSKGWTKAGCTKPYMTKVPPDPLKSRNYVYKYINKDSYVVTARLEGTINNLSGVIKLTPNSIQ